MTTALEADKKAADDAFRLRIDEYTLADARGLAPPHISAKLRSEKWSKEWNTCLAQLAASVAARGGSKELRTKIAELRIEASKCARQARALKEQNNISLKEEVLKRCSMDLPDALSLHEMSVVLQAELLAEIRKLNKTYVQQATGEE